MAEGKSHGTLGSFITVIIVIGAVLLGLIAMDRKRQRTAREAEEKAAVQKEKQEAHQGKEAKAIEELGKKYNAVLDWKEGLNNTLDIQETLEKTDKEFLLFTSRIQDFIKEKGRQYIIFGPTFMRGLLSINTIFLIECDQETVTKLRASEDRFDDFAVVAKNLSIENALLDRLEHSFRTKNTVAPKHFLILKGECVEILPLDRPPVVESAGAAQQLRVPLPQ